MELKIILSLSALLVVSFIVNNVEAQSSSQDIQNPCTSKSTCQECIQTPSCVWCYDPNFKSNVRCFHRLFPTPTSEQCPEEFVYDPDNVMRILINIPLTVPGGHDWSSSTYGTDYEAIVGRHKNGDSGVITQIRPQRLGLKLRTRNRYNIRMFYTQAEDYPVDLYYLKGFSKSMDNKQKLSKLGDHLAEAMPNITTNFALGLGSLVNSIPEKSVSPCTGCGAPYGFRNYMSLSTDANQFSAMLRKASTSGNLEAPGGGLDAIMQAVVCRGEIGWRETARRILVFSTDADFHYDGDGKVDGVVKPNDGRCHLNSTGYYTMSEKQDYPSISQINDYVKKNAINVIFAVTPDKIDACKQLQSHIEGATCGILSNDLTNIVELIRQQYEQISSTVEMKHNASSAVNIKFSTKCLNHNGALIETNKCSNVKVGDLLEFHVDLEVIKCPKNRVDWTQRIQIYPVGIKESLTIDLEMLCDCPCEHPGDVYYFENAPQCHHNGTYKCGLCDCNEGLFGKFCECSGKKPTTDCTSPLDHLECSGRGTCICGECTCETRPDPNELIFGRYCECDNFSCERHLDKLCSGHGTCTCGVCTCHEGWIDSNCACQNSTESCYPSDSDRSHVCSGNGVCTCGKCVCNTTEDGLYTGEFCEILRNYTLSNQLTNVFRRLGRIFVTIF